MKKIVFDLLNNDNGEEQAILGAKRFLQENSDYFLILVGHEQLIKKHLSDYIDRIAIINNETIVHIESSPRDVLRTQNSMLEAFKQLNESNADGILSSGDSGSLITLSSLKVKRLLGIERPAFMPILPTITDKKMLLIDAGANIEIKPEYLSQWAMIASEWYSILFGSKKPIVGQLNVGVEEYKGSEITKNAKNILKEVSKSANFVFNGYVEATNAINGDIDILVVDGYGGNVFLKTLEGTFIAFSKLLKNILLKNWKTKLAALILKRHLREFKQKFDYRNTGGAFIIGLEKIVVKAHGGSDELAFYNALNQIKIGIENNISTILNKKFKEADNEE